MNKIFYMFLAVGLSASCGGKELRVDRTIEEGVEVILNHIEPYRIKGQPTTFSLQQILSIDLERDDLARAGLMGGGEWDTDIDGNIFVVGFKNSENFIYRFDREGRLMGSFGKRGQGPGELSGPSLSGVYGGEIALSDFLGMKYVVYDLDGRVLRERRLDHPDRLNPLGNGNFVCFGPQIDPAAKAFYYALTLRDPGLNELKVLDRYEFPSDDSRQVPFFMWRVSGDQIIVANEARGYELWVFDLDGRLIRKIRKEYRPVKVTEEIKSAILGPDYRKSGSSLNRYFSDPLPPLNQFFTDDEGRIFVMTYEAEAHPGEYTWDIFNPEGVFIGRVALDVLWSGLYLGSRYTFIKKGQLYSHRVKESGYHELIVSRVLWR